MRRENDFYSLFKPGNLFLLHQRERTMLNVLRQHGVDQAALRQMDVLEVGCGSGGLLPHLALYGGNPRRMVGVDLDGERVREASQRNAAMSFATGDAARLPLRTGSFDLVVQSTLFTSLLDPGTRKQTAAEMRRVLRPGKFILWHDFRFNSPQNPAVRRVTMSDLRQLFPDADISVRRTMLIPPLARRLVPMSRTLAEILSLFPLMRSHYCGVIQPR